jgi:hypothetical protein
MSFLKSGILPLLFIILIISCKKDPGPGGLASIRGKVFGTDVTASFNMRDSGYLGNQRVFISVANDPIYFDDVRTSYDGSFEFSFLRKGSYDVWSYSDCDTCTWKQQMVIRKGIEIDDKKETVTIEDLRVIF